MFHVISIKFLLVMFIIYFIADVIDKTYYNYGKVYRHICMDSSIAMPTNDIQRLSQTNVCIILFLFVNIIILMFYNFMIP